MSRLRKKTKKPKSRRTNGDKISTTAASQSAQSKPGSHKPKAVEQSISTSNPIEARASLSHSMRKRGSTQRDLENKLRSSFDSKEGRKLSLYADPRVQTHQTHVVQDLERYADSDYESTDDENVNQSRNETTEGNQLQRNDRNGDSNASQMTAGSNGLKLSEEKDLVDDFEQIEKFANAFGGGMQGNNDVPPMHHNDLFESGGGYGSRKTKTLRPVRVPLKRRSSGSIPNSIFDKQKENHSWQEFSGFHKHEPITRESSNSSQRQRDLVQEGSYASLPELEIEKLPRGGISIETEAVGRVQFGIPPETIKDSMVMGLDVPTIYIVPTERFCREMGPALGVNLAEFEFPAYFNFFVKKRRCQLVVDEEAETNIRRVFNETLLGPAQFRRENDSISFEPEDFAPNFPREAIPNFEKELRHFRTNPDGSELTLETLLEFCHFKDSPKMLGIPPPMSDLESAQYLNSVERQSSTGSTEVHLDQILDAAKEDGFSLLKAKQWTYAKTKEINSVATVYPADASLKDIQQGKVKRIEIFKEENGTLYFIHDIDENNVIRGKAKFSGHVRVSESMGIDGFGESNHDNGMSSLSAFGSVRNLRPSFHPPSFGVTVLGNSHGFDKSGSTSGYVLWINGRGIMIDPPPYSSATLEREGIRRRTIVGIILTHCHADHDAGAFQKVLSGSPVVVITTPTIYKSFIRKYAALSNLSPALLRHSHRHKSAKIGEPLRFQGANFYFIYTLHTIPCVGFRVEWRGKSIVFTGDHFNSPDGIDKLQNDGILSQQRADQLRNLPLQDTDLLLHEAGAPPIHTPLEVLTKLPQRVKDHLYVVHTSALPPDCGLRVAPTGTAGTMRLDEYHLNKRFDFNNQMGSLSESSVSNFDEYDEQMAARNLAATMISNSDNLQGSGRIPRRNNMNSSFRIRKTTEIPLVARRPTSSTDAWFLLNLLFSVPFLSSLSYSSTMEVLETAKVDTFYQDEIVVKASRRKHVLCVVWEGTCIEQMKMDTNGDEANWESNRSLLPDGSKKRRREAVWHAGDWTGPRSLQPEKTLSGERSKSELFDIVAMSSEGVKAITIEMSYLHTILKEGSPLYRKYLLRQEEKERRRGSQTMDSEVDGGEVQDIPPLMLQSNVVNMNLIELLDCNSALRKLSAVQKRHIESLAEGPIYFQPGQRLWKSGSPVDRAFIIVAGTAAFVTKRPDRVMKWHSERTMGTAAWHPQDRKPDPQDAQETMSSLDILSISLADAIASDAQKEQNFSGEDDNDDSSDSSLSSLDSENDKNITFDNPPEQLNEVSVTLKHRASLFESSFSPDLIDNSSFSSLAENSNSESTDSSNITTKKIRKRFLRRRSSRDRFANKVLGKLNLTNNLVFSRGTFLGDVSKMVAKRLLSSEKENRAEEYDLGYGYGAEATNIENEMIIQEREGDNPVVHTSTLAAGKDGCVVVIFPKVSLITFLDEYPGLLLSLLGTQVMI